MSKQPITAWTDGACSGNPGPGGWAALIDGELISDYWDRPTTNNAMELFAIYQVLDYCPPDSDITIHTDSRLAIGLWSGRMRTQYKHLADIVRSGMAVASSKRQIVRLVKTDGHAGVRENERVDKAARAQTRIARNALAARGG